MVFKVVYGIGFVLIFVIRLPYFWMAKSSRVVTKRRTMGERILLGLLSIGIGALPLLYLFTSWLSFADYRLRDCPSNGVSGLTR